MCVAPDRPCTCAVLRRYSAAWRASSALCEWAVCALDRMLLLLRSRAKPAAGGMARHIEASQGRVLSTTFRLLFQQMSPSLLKRSRRKVMEWLASNACLDADKDVAAMLAALSAADPASTLELFVPHLADKIRGSASSEKFLTWCVAPRVLLLLLLLLGHHSLQRDAPSLTL